MSEFNGKPYFGETSEEVENNIQDWEKPYFGLTDEQIENTAKAISSWKEPTNPPMFPEKTALEVALEGAKQLLNEKAEKENA